MASLRCPCGARLRSTELGRAKAGWSLVLTPSELQAFDDHCQAVAIASDEAARAIIAKEPLHRELWTCPKCGRLALDRAPGSVEVDWFRPEVRAQQKEQNDV